MSVTDDAGSVVAPRDRLVFARFMHLALSVLLLGSVVASLAIGASGVSLWGALGKLITGEALTQPEKIILFDVRLPRTLMGLLVGAALAVSGAVLQGLFRNPLADPGIVGVSAGAGLGAISAIVLGGLLPVAVLQVVGEYLVPVAAFVGGWIVVLVLYGVSTHEGRTSVVTMLLAGIAVGAMAGALSGIIIYMADDAQLRDLTFWGLGSLNGATLPKVQTVGPIILIAVALACFLGRALNGLALGEATAMHLGISVQSAKRVAIFAVAAATGSAVAVSGGIGFVGIVVPHLLRLATGPDHRPLLLNSALLGAALLLWSDVFARIVVAPAELPIGIITAVLGSPVFLWILLRQRGRFTA